MKYASNTRHHDGFYFFSGETGGGSDCANFVSQSLLAGGMHMSKEWYWRGVYGDLKEYPLGYTLSGRIVDASASWLRPDELYRYLIKPENSYGVSYITSVNDIPKIAHLVKPGDVIAFNNLGEGIPKGYINHVAIVTEVKNGEIYYSSHSNKRENEPLREVLTKNNYQGDLYFIHTKYE